MRKDAIVAAAGIAGSQDWYLSTPHLARLYSAQEFGVYAAVVAVILLLRPFFPRSMQDSGGRRPRCPSTSLRAALVLQSVRFVSILVCSGIFPEIVAAFGSR